MTDDILANNGINLEDGLVNAGDSSVGLADFLDIDTSEIDANEGGFENLPQGIYQFTTSDINIAPTKRTIKDTGEEVTIPNITVKFKVDNVINTIGYDGDEAKLIGRTQTEFYSLPTYDNEMFAKAVGSLYAIAQKLGGKDKGYHYANVKLAVTDMANKTFTAKIKHRKYTNRNGEEVAVANIDSRSIQLA